MDSFQQDEGLDFENGDGCVDNEITIVIPQTRRTISPPPPPPPPRSSSVLPKDSYRKLLDSGGRLPVLRRVLNDLQVLSGTKLALLFPAIPLAIIANFFDFGRAWIFVLSLLGLTPLAERISFLTEQIAYFTGPTVGGLMNATCGNATELIIAIFALRQNKVQVLKYSLLGSILSNLLLVLGTSLISGGLANLSKDQTFDRKQADINLMLLLLGLLCQMLPSLFRYGGGGGSDYWAHQSLRFSRASSMIMLLAYVAYIIFQLKTHRQLFESQDQEDEGNEGKAAIGFWSAFGWLIVMTTIMALLSEYVVGTIEAASSSWGISISFISIIVLPIVGNAAEHAASVIFALKNELDISLGVAIGSTTQISIFLVPLCVEISWIMGGHMDLDFDLLETVSIAFAIIITAFALQDGTSHYMKGKIQLASKPSSSEAPLEGCAHFDGERPSDKSDAGRTSTRTSSQKSSKLPQERSDLKLNKPRISLIMYSLYTLNYQLYVSCTCCPARASRRFINVISLSFTCFSRHAVERCPSKIHSGVASWQCKPLAGPYHPLTSLQ
ncbi:vacuolar cation/proton exchanger 3-like isoform X2 [Syzygium oleosum]|uniref:vacuolar cation/proton exchanger 3-like isoform X2 n=1 Tax=Syzygium oleosum TaxID=219896 RepID=UPI0024B8D484|nr:vacuolar cation/proton exchanger 3-like isoform X2 [Syzygium oleosum]